VRNIVQVESSAAWFIAEAKNFKKRRWGRKRSSVGSGASSREKERGRRAGGRERAREKKRERERGEGRGS
jgi:hypothetical protein